jgi:transposase
LQVDYLSPGDTLIIDNCAIHNSDILCDLLHSYGVSVLFLPPYSPSCNPIEFLFNKFKSLIPTVSLAFPDSPICALISLAFSAITADDCAGFARHCGY